MATAYEPGLWSIVAPSLSSHPTIVAAVLYADDTNPVASNVAISVPTIYHLAAGSMSGGFSSMAPADLINKTYHYPTVSSYKFAMPFQQSFSYNTENISQYVLSTCSLFILDSPTFKNN